MKNLFLLTYLLHVTDERALISHAREILRANEEDDGDEISTARALAEASTLEANYLHPMQIPNPVDVGFEIVDRWCEEMNSPRVEASESKALALLREFERFYLDHANWQQRWMEDSKLLQRVSSVIKDAEDGDGSQLHQWSVLLLYPQWMSFEPPKVETFYSFELAADARSAITLAQAKAFEHNELDCESGHSPKHFVPLLVTRGHNYGQRIEEDES